MSHVQSWIIHMYAWRGLKPMGAEMRTPPRANTKVSGRIEVLESTSEPTSKIDIVKQVAVADHSADRPSLIYLYQ